ncbi:MAG: TlpA family protein disulfide reductase [Acidobacteria bacterium]|nr:TlpA family protein disulfide reductase [Acidobacteriota bacterium]
MEKLHGLRRLPDDVRAHATKDLALAIRALPASPNKIRLAHGLANLSTEGDFGHDTLQQVATTLADSLRETPNAQETAYFELAQLVRYEHVQVASDAPQLQKALAQMEATDQVRDKANFTLTALDGKKWTLKELQGKVVLVNFWATWCPPCRKEIPDLEVLYRRFENQGLVVLAISDEPEDKVKPFIAENKVTYPVLLDPDDNVHKLFDVEGIPHNFVYDRAGKLVTQSIDMRTQRQFLEMLAQAGIQTQ